MTAAFLDHLWQSTLVAVLAYALTLLFRKQSASIRHWLWFAASVKFLLPFSLLTALGRMAFVHTVPASSIVLLTRIQPAAAPFSAVAAVPAAEHHAWLILLAAVWLLGLIALASFWLMRWCRLSATVRGAKILSLDAPVPVRSTPLLLEPGLVGVWRPVILLPEGIAGRLSRTEIDAILSHELCHLRRRDNLLAMVHMLVEGIFWFHPLVWFIGARLVEERERACDESVLAGGRNPLEYAWAILKVCRLYFRSPLACASGVSGADLERRVTAIMARQDIQDIDVGRKFLLAALGAIVVMAPLMVGGLKSAPATLMAQSLAQGFTKVLSPLEQAGDQAPVITETASPAAPVREMKRHSLHGTALGSSIQPRQTALVAPAIDVSMPVIIVPIPQLDSGPAAPQAVASDTDTLVCRPPQQLPGTRMAGPRVCLPKAEWDRIRQQGLQLMPDGKTLATNYEKERSLNPRNCPAIPAGASTALGTWNVSCFVQ